MHHRPAYLKEEVDQGVASVLVVPEDEQRPVHEPGALLQLLQWLCEALVVQQVLQLGHIFHGRVEVWGHRGEEVRG